MRRLIFLAFAAVALAFPVGSSATIGGPPQSPADDYESGVYNVYSVVDWDTFATGGSICFRAAWQKKWGTWPYHQIVTIHTKWCSHGTYTNITYVNSWIDTDSYLCSAHDRYVYTVAGGTGAPTVTRIGGAYFNCPIYGFIPVNNNRFFYVEYTAGGGSQGW